ncbi:MAG: hypothetical protein WBM04_19930 [Candidatus Korobacteraceae bacterium]
MAKKDEQKANGSGQDSGQIKVRVIEFELNGRNATLAEGIKAITTAIASRAVVVREPARPGLPAAPAPSTTTSTAVSDLEEALQQDVDPGAVEEEEVQEVGGTEASNGNGSGAKRGYNYKAPKFMDELDFSTATKSLEDYAAEKGNPTDTMDKYLLTAVWFKEHMKIDEVTVHHIYTAFDHVGWKTDMAVNPSAPLRDLKSKRHVLTREPGAAGYKVNFKGEQYVARMGAGK